MNEQSFVDRREADWRRLTILCERTAEAGMRRLQGDELKELIRLYRRASTDLALARTKSTNIPLITFLNDLTGRAYGILYRAPKRPFFKTIGEALAICAQTVRRNKWFVLTSASIFFGSAIFIYFLIGAAPEVHDRVVSPGMKSTFDAWKSGKFEERSGSQSGMMAAFYASNNPKVSIITGAVGAGSFGLISVYFLFQNGAILGALAHDVAPVGQLWFLVSSISPHGVPELSGIIMAGACGLLLGYALINPGRRRRADALRAVGKDAIVLLAISVGLTLIAAPIEGFFSFQPSVPQWVKAVVALVSLCGWLAIWIGFGRTPGPDPHPLGAD